MHNSCMINLHMADFGVKRKVKKVFYSSSACMYPAYNQEDPNNPNSESQRVSGGSGQRVRMGKTF